MKLSLAEAKFARQKEGASTLLGSHLDRAVSDGGKQWSTELSGAAKNI